MAADEVVDAVVIGAGIIGTAAAYHLARSGVGRVVIVEADEPGAGATGGSFGGIRQQFKHPLEIEFSRRGLAFWKGAEKSLKHPCPFHEDGYLLLTSDKTTAAELGEAAELQRSMGLPDVHLLGSDELSELVPWVNLDGLVCGSWTPGDGHVMPMDGVSAYLSAGRLLGVELRNGWPVTRLSAVNGDWHVEGKETTLVARLVVVAAGHGTKALLEPFGVDLDIRRVTQYSLLTEPAFVGKHIPMTIDLDSGLCVEREASSLVLAMIGRNPPPSDHADLVERFMAAASHRAPALAELRIVKNITAHPTVGGDGMPYVGEVEPSLWAIAFVGHGAMHGPPLAEVVVRAMVGDPDTSVDLAPWDLRRTPGSPTVWWRRKATG